MRKAMMVVMVCAAAIVACNFPTASSSSTPPTPLPGADDGTTPTVEIEPLPGGAQSYIGGRVEIRVRARDSIGITRVEMQDSGRVVVTQPSPDPTTSFEAILTYIPTYTGSVTLTVIAYRRSVASPPATVALSIVRTAADLDNPNALNPTTGVAAGAICSVKVNVNNLNLRAGPATTFDRLAQLAVGEDLIVTGRNADSTWYQVKRANTTRGWVSAQYVIPTGDCGQAPIINQ